MKVAVLSTIIAILLAFLTSTANADPAPNFCNSGEKVYFSCKIAGKDKILSVCGAKSEQLKWEPIQYRFGDNKKIELTYPERAIKGGGFKFSRYTRPQATYLSLKFYNAGFAYEVFSNSNTKAPLQASHPRTEDVEYGVRITKDGTIGKPTELFCQKPVTDNMIDLEGVIQSTE